MSTLTLAARLHLHTSLLYARAPATWLSLRFSLLSALTLAARLRLHTNLLYARVPATRLPLRYSLLSALMLAARLLYVSYYDVGLLMCYIVTCILSFSLRALLGRMFSQQQT